MARKVTVYIPCYNAERYLKVTLEGVLAQTYRPDEILVIDDGSTDKTAQVARQFPVRLIQHPRNKGLAAARNTAIKYASHEFLAAVDADVVPERDWLQYLLDAFVNDSVAGAGGRLVERFQNSPADRWRALHLPQDLGEERVVIKWPSHERLSGFGTVFRKSALERIGGYDERYRTNYEDVDISKRLLAAGYTLIYEPRAVAYHIRRDTPYSVIRTAWHWDFWVQYHNGGYKNIWLKLLQNFRWAWELVRQHLEMRETFMLPVDLLYLALYCYWDLRYYFSNQSTPRHC